MKTNCRLTVGIVSCNRLFFLKNLLNSLKQSVNEKIELIVVDNASSEKNLKNFLVNEKLIDKLIIEKVRKPKTEHINALNKIVELATSDYLLILSDDVQFVRKNWLDSCINLLENNNDIVSVSLSALRKNTIKHYFKFSIHHLKEILKDLIIRKKIRQQKNFIQGNSNFSSFGYMREAIDGVGMLALSRTELWKKLYPWKINDSSDILDSSNGGEFYMIQKARKKKVNGHMVMPTIPIVATIVTDKDGYNAKVRGNYRFGNYFPPLGSLYYKFIDKSYSKKILSFEEIITPIGFFLPLDKKSNLIKKSINLNIKKIIN